MQPDAYLQFLRSKIAVAAIGGFEVSDADINPILKPFQRAIVRWAVRGGQRAIFARFGLGKTIIQLEVLRLTLAHAGGRGLIVAPLGVRQEFVHDVNLLNTGDDPSITDEQRAELYFWQNADHDRLHTLRFIRRIEEADETGLYITNYETIRDGKMDPREFTAASLDEASVLRGFGGTKTFREFMRLFAGDGKTLHERVRSAGVRYRFVATATPSPNEYIELLAYSAYLGVMDVGQAKTRFFKRNSEKADQLTLHPHKEKEFWLWVASWGLFVQYPSELGFSNEGYDLPPLDIRWHEVPTDHLATAGTDKSGQGKMFKDASINVQNAAAEKRESLDARMAKLMEIRAEDPTAHRVLWHDLERERLAIEKAIPEVVSIYGSQDLDTREQAIIDFSAGRIAELAAKPVIAGSGCNFQRHCAWEVFLGIGFKFNDFIQAVHRCYRFLQTKPVRIDLIYSEAERGVRQRLLEKWQRHDELMATMSEIIQKYGLSEAAMASTLQRSLGVERVEVVGDGYRLANNDCVLEARRMPADSVHLIITSIPFSSQYEYTPSYHDLGHSDHDAQFWAQMDFLTPELLRVLKPGRVAAIHVKDRIVPGGLTGLGFQTLNPFSDACVAHFQRHGFAFLARKTVTTDVVRENNQTYRLGWTEQCKDGSRMGCGVPEYVLLFRKPPTDSSNGYADEPVVKDKKVSTSDGWENPNGYSRARWQLDAHAFMRSRGDRLVMPEELVGLPADQVYQIFRKFSVASVYDFEHHVRIGEALEVKGSLPPTFMLLPPASWHPDVWSDVARMRTLNSSQAAKGKEMHLCPLQFDIVDRLIRQFSMEGETVFDPFAGIGTVPVRAVKLRRRGEGSELNPGYFLDSVAYVRAEAENKAMPSLFDFIGEGQVDEADDREVA
jgi:DNA modification methylase